MKYKCYCLPYFGIIDLNQSLKIITTKKDFAILFQN